MTNTLISINTTSSIPYPTPKSFTLSTPPKTDIYAAPAHGYVFTAPILCRRIQASSFKSARATLSFPWTTIYDQGGLILIFPSASNPLPDGQNASSKEAHPKWVKAGIEINDGKPWASVVARENWADWSLSVPPEGVVGDGMVKATIEFERKEGALFVYASAADGKGRAMIREPQWPFLDGRGESDILIGVYTCSPDPKGERNGQPLEVTFENFEIVER